LGYADRVQVAANEGFTIKTQIGEPGNDRWTKAKIISYIALPVLPFAALAICGFARLIYSHDPLYSSTKKALGLEQKIDAFKQEHEQTIRYHAEKTTFPKVDVSLDIFPNIDDYSCLTWMHGTKALVIKLACEHTQGELRPLGELKRQNTPLSTGTLDAGATSQGVNQHSLSGVSLQDAYSSILYACTCPPDLNCEISLYRSLLTPNYKEMPIDSESLGHRLRMIRDVLPRQVEALRRVQRENSDLFRQDQPLFLEKIKEIELFLRAIFETQPECIFNWHDLYHPNNFHNFLIAFEELKNLVHNPLQGCPSPPSDRHLATIPIVIASFTKQGISIGSEKLYPGNLLLGRDLQVIFTQDEHIATVQTLVSQHHLSIKVDSFTKLKQASSVLNPRCSS